MAYTRQNFKDGQCLCAHHLKAMEDALCEAACVEEAKAGQVLAVAGVDSTGKPTGYKAVNMSGGGGGGTSPVIEVTDIEGGHRVFITDVNGSQYFDVMDGEDGDASNAIPAHNAHTSAHSGLFAKKADKAAVVENSGAFNFAIANNTEYTLTNVSSLTMAGNTNEAHGFVTFGASAPSVSVTGFTASGGDDIASANASEVWEFSCNNGFIIWKKWSA
jgi:hypothetical protein